jgi:hypothetical protein
MLIAQAFAEYGLMPTLIDSMYWLRVHVEEALRTSGFAWLGIVVAVVVVLKLARR